MKKQISQSDLILDFFRENPKRNIKHPEVVDWVTKEWKNRTGDVFRDPDRQIRLLSQKGLLQKISKGVYRYDPDFIGNRMLKDFTPSQKAKILARDGYRCVICGRGEADGIELQVDHIKAKDLGGEATIENGQTLCAQHNFRKKNYKQTETGKKMFFRLYGLAKSIGDIELQKFCVDILEVFEKNNVNGHIEWER
ncbi:MAG TPA: HNH endonuclease [Bacteroidales bacterium]|nr:HNH endonuclease [Bacteroidales bacterium]